MDEINVVKQRRITTAGVIITAVIAVALVFAGLFIWRANYGPCGRVRMRQATAEVQVLLTHWDDASSVAASTSRIALAAPISELQAIRRDLEGRELPVCMQKWQRLTLDGFAYSIEGYLAFMGNDEKTTEKMMILGSQQLVFAAEEMDRLTNCIPNCLP